MANIGYATLSIIPSARGIGPEIRRQITPELERLGTQVAPKVSDPIGKSLRDRLVDGAKNAGQQIGQVLSNVATGAGATAGALFGTALFSGFSRLSAIDDAQAKLKGLGHEAQAIETIMGSALDSVRGTAFGLGDAATVAATAVAAGVKEGEELTRYLKLVADTATISGASLSEVGQIINKTTTSGRVFTMELNQLADRGLPVFTWLQDAYGVTAEELRKMVAAGEIDAATFRQILEENIGGAALASGESFRGGLANVRAALGRMGAEFLGPFFEGAKGVFPALIATIDQITAVVSEAMGRLADSPGFQRVLDWFAGLPDKVGPFMESLRGLGPVVAPLAGAFAALASSNIAGLLGPFGALLPKINPLVGAIVALVAATPELREVLISVAQAAMPLVEVLGGAVQEALVALAPIVGQLASALGSALVPIIEALLAAVTPLIPPIVEVVSILGGALAQAVEALAPVMPPLGEAIGQIAIALGEILLALVPVLIPLAELAAMFGEKISGPLLVKLAEAVTKLAQGLGVIATVVADILSAGLGTLVEWIGSLMEGLADLDWSTVSEFFTGLPGRVLEWIGTLHTVLIPKGLELLGGLLAGIIEKLPDLARWWLDLNVKVLAWIGDTARTLLGKGIELLGGLLAGVLQKLPDLLIEFVLLPLTILELLADAARWLIPKGVELIGGLLAGLIEKLPEIITFFATLPARVIGWLGNVARTLVPKALELLGGLITGLIEKLPDIAAWFAELPGRILGFLGDAGSWLFDAGRAILQGLIDGMLNMRTAVLNWLGDLGSKMKDKVLGIFGISSPSKVFAGYGRDLMRGLALGIEDAADLPVAALGSLSLEPSWDATGGLADRPDAPTAADRGLAAEITINTHTTATAPEIVRELSWLSRTGGRY